ncbi:hypothetical protein D3C80_2070970 [compost metagenome]
MAILFLKCLKKQQQGHFLRVQAFAHTVFWQTGQAPQCIVLQHRRVDIAAPAYGWRVAQARCHLADYRRDLAFGFILRLPGQWLQQV